MSSLLLCWSEEEKSKLDNSVMNFLNLDSYEDCPLNELSSSSFTVKAFFKWEVVLLALAFFVLMIIM